MAEQALTKVTFDSAFGEVTLTAADVKKYLVRGNGNVTDQEIKLFLELCKYQKLNPFTNECYAIKFGDDFQIVVGYEAYKRRAEEHPEYAGRKSGIVVLRGDQVIQKEGTCLYPSETLVGGWCRVFRLRDGAVDETFKEVGFSEYDKQKANWKTKPCTMIEKVAVSQALRAAFPKDYEGMYTPEETSPVGSIPDAKDSEVVYVDEPISQKDRQKLFGYAQHLFGVEEGNALVKSLICEMGLDSTEGMLKSQLDSLMKKLEEISKETPEGKSEYQVANFTEVDE